ncbi:MAG: AEC family transporter [Clostridia bacterium]|nr:AEC family transporter [Clostridia bacterium]
MMDFFLKAATQILMVLLYIANGFILRRSKMLPETTSKTLSVMETLVFLPALLFNNLSTNVKIEKITTYSKTILFGAVFLVFVLLIAFVFTKLFMKGRPKEEYGTYMYMFAFANYGYFGYPLIEYVFGSEMLASMILFAIPFTFAIYTYGAYLLSSDGSSKKITIPKKMIPILCAIVLGVLVGLLDLKLPTVITQTTSALKSCMSPVSMLMTGFVLGSLKFKNIFTSLRAYLVSAVRLIVIPLLFGAGLLLLGAKGEFMIIPMFIASMPIGLNAVVFVEASGRDSTDNARMCLISYILSFITVPLIMAFLSQYQ